MVISELLKKVKNELSENGIENSHFEALHLVGFVLRMSTENLILNASERVLKTDKTKVLNLVTKRISGVPFQYLLGTQEFMSLEFSVSPDVLIPRQDTETLAEFVLEKCGNRPLSVLDIGTGSGCIPISLAYFKPNLTCVGIDISIKALNLAKKNAETLNVSDRVTFEKCDILNDLPKSRFDIVISNPPYIKSSDIPLLQKEVRDFEPHLALDGGIDGLVFYKRICDKAPEFLKQGGLLAFETGFDQTDAVTALMQNDFDSIRGVKDLCGNNRVVFGYLKKER